MISTVGLQVGNRVQLAAIPAMTHACKLTTVKLLLGQAALGVAGRSSGSSLQQVHFSSRPGHIPCGTAMHVPRAKGKDTPCQDSEAGCRLIHSVSSLITLHRQWGRDTTVQSFAAWQNVILWVQPPALISCTPLQQTHVKGTHACAHGTSGVWIVASTQAHVWILDMDVACQPVLQT